MGNRYEELMCNTCGQMTTHRITRKYGHKGESFHRRRETTKCLGCQSKIIDNSKKGKQRHSTFISFNKNDK